MPATLNGIGTHYYGKKNLVQRSGVCRHCGRISTLSSYDTRLWFVILFLPVIPLGRKRIIDACASCRTHAMADLRQWKTAKQLETSGALERFRSEPTPENAIEAHRQLMIFQQLEDASELQQTMLEKFSDNAKVHLYLGQALDFLGRNAEAEPLFSRALELRPDLPEARVGVAEGCLRRGELDKAKQLLDFLNKPGAGQLYPLAPLEQLALAFARAGNHGEALELFGQLLKELPQIAQHPAFRKSVKASEKALGRSESILPKSKFSWRQFFGRRQVAGRVKPVVAWGGLAVLGVILFLVLVGFVFANEHARRHRDIYVVNSSSAIAQVDISGHGSTRLLRGVNKITLPEGHYRMKVSGVVTQEIDLDVHTSYWSRWSGRPVWVVNPGATALLVEEQAHYSKTPRPSSFTLHYGQSLYAFGDIDCPFVALPRSVSASAGQQERVLLHLEVSTAVKGFYHLLSQKRVDEAYRLAEWALTNNPGDEEMIAAYSNPVPGQEARVESFLRAGLSNRPVQIAWHRAYQSQLFYTPRAERLVNIYDQMLRADPTNSALLYLYGRILGDHAAAKTYFENAHAADPSNAYPIFALGYDQAALGDWKRAKAFLDEAVKLRPNDPDMLQIWENACVATEDFSFGEKLFRERLNREPKDWGSTLRLCDLLLAGGKTNEAERLILGYNKLMSSYGPDGAAQIRLAKEYLSYATGRFAELERLARQDESNQGRQALFWALIEQNRMQEAVEVYPPDKLKDPIICLSISLAYRVAGKEIEAARWQARTLAILNDGGADSHQAASLLKGEIQPSQAALDRIVWPMNCKALLMANLSLMHPQWRPQLCAGATQLNVERTFSYHLIQRATSTP